jgi:putative membrane protein
MALGFAVAMKYRLRRQLSYNYPDLIPYIQNLSTFAKTAYLADGPLPSEQWSSARRVAINFGIPGAHPDPLKRICRGASYHGNLPLEILSYLNAYAEIIVRSGAMPSPAVQIQLLGPLASLTDCLTGMERVLATPLPLAYRIAISQISWMYILALPFQLVTYLGWITIPGTLGKEYSRLG